MSNTVTKIYSTYNVQFITHNSSFPNISPSIPAAMVTTSYKYLVILIKTKVQYIHFMYCELMARGSAFQSNKYLHIYTRNYI